MHRNYVCNKKGILPYDNLLLRMQHQLLLYIVERGSILAILWLLILLDLDQLDPKYSK